MCIRDRPSNAAQYFHLLRRQALRHWRKPLVVFTPKSMLRHPDASSPIEMCIRDSGYITRVIARFDLPAGTQVNPGDEFRYVWHCHVLEHEDNEMMRPYKIIA